MKELENKIREALPRLKSLTDGAIVYRPHWNVFKQEYDKGVYDELELRNGHLFEDDEKVDSYPFCIGDDWYVGHPIKLNDVLEWLNIVNDCNFLMFSDGCLCKFDEEFNDYYPINNKTFELRVVNSVNTLHWDLSSVFLADQSEELKEFLNRL